MIPSKDDATLLELEQQYSQHPLSYLGYWHQWQDFVKAALPMFAGECIYLAQHYNQSEFERVANWLLKQCQTIDLKRSTVDCQHGARAVLTSLGLVTRGFLDAQVEIAFIERTLDLSGKTVLDIGAGYGRLAVYINDAAPTSQIYCVDAVPISTYLQRFYTSLYAPAVKVLTLRDFDRFQEPIDLTINVHSWSECSLAQISSWVSRLTSKYLFTGSNTKGYETWGGSPNSGKSFRPVLKERYKLLDEKSDIGVDRNSTYAMWEMK